MRPRRVLNLVRALRFRRSAGHAFVKIKPPNEIRNKNLSDTQVRTRYGVTAGGITRAGSASSPTQPPTPSSHPASASSSPAIGKVAQFSGLA